MKGSKTHKYLLDVKFDLVKKSLSLSKLHWTLWLLDILLSHPGSKKSFWKTQAQKVKTPGSNKSFWKTSFDVLMEWSCIITHGVRQLFLVTNHVRFWKKQNALLLCQNWIFFKNSVYHICNGFLRKLSTEKKKKWIINSTLFLKKTLCWRWKEQNHFQLSQSHFRRLSAFMQKNEEISKFFILCLVLEEVWNEIGRNSFPVDSLQV